MYEAPSVRKAFEIIDVIAQRDKHMTMSELSRQLGINKSTLHGITRALEEMGVVSRNSQTRRYTLGTTLFELARMAYARIDLRDLAHPVMEELMNSTRQTVFLGVRSNNHVSIVEIVESTQDLKVTAHVGARLPLLVGATGKAFMAAVAEAEAARLIRTVELRRHTEKSIIDPDRYMEEVQKARACGYALDDGEYMEGVRAVAASIRAQRHPMSAIWVVGLTQGMKAEEMTSIAIRTKAAAEAISCKFDLHQFEDRLR